MNVSQWYRGKYLSKLRNEPHGKECQYDSITLVDLIPHMVNRNTLNNVVKNCHHWENNGGDIAVQIKDFPCVNKWSYWEGVKEMLEHGNTVESKDFSASENETEYTHWL